MNIDYDTEYELKDQIGTLKSGDVHIGKALAHLTGTFNAATAVTHGSVKADRAGNVRAGP